ncbi:efflux RND transporter permease subunit, partial [Treponema sp. R6D11]
TAAATVPGKNKGSENSKRNASEIRTGATTPGTQLPPDIKITEIFNPPDMVLNFLIHVTSSVFYGALLAVMILVIFVRSIKPTLSIRISIPVSLIISMMIR